MGIDGAMAPRSSATLSEVVEVYDGLRLFLVEAGVTDGEEMSCADDLDEMMVTALGRRLALPGDGCLVIAGERDLARKWAAGRTGRLVSLHILPAAIGSDLPLDRSCPLAPGPTVLPRDGASPWAQAALRAVDDIIVTELAEPSRSVYRMGKALEILALVLSAADHASPLDVTARLARRERTKLVDARDRLLTDLAQPPSLSELAQSVGLTERRLNEGFRTMFGLTAFELLRNARLDHAQRLIAESDVPLKDVAWRVGYRHVTNFISAYRNRFGTTPGRQARRYLAGGPQLTVTGCSAIERPPKSAGFRRLDDWLRGANFPE